MKNLTVFLMVLFFATSVNSQIILDENYSDWDSVAVAYDDAADDINGQIAFGNFKIDNDNSFIYFYLEIGKEINLQDNNKITLFIDADNNASTGKQTMGIGAEIEFIFGERRGFYYGGNTTISISQNDISLLSSPTVSSDKFEFLIDRNMIIAGSSVFENTSIRVAVADNNGGDFMPNESGGILYNLKDALLQIPRFSIARSELTHLRVMSFNVRRDDLFDANKKQYFGRLIKAINPDIIGFQEIYDHSASQTEAFVNEFLPGQWYSDSKNNDNKLVSRFPIVSSFAIDGNAAFLIDISSTQQSEQMLFVSAHTPCCNNDDERQKEIDNIMAFIRDVKSGTGALQLIANSPIVIVGDMNLVGYSRQQYTFYSGDILNESIYGSDFAPDWDSSFFEDAKPVTTGMPATFTWKSESSSFSPGRLDYIIYSGSVLILLNSFALYTQELPTDTLTAYGLTAADTEWASDHTPIAADFRIKILEDVKHEETSLYRFELKQNFPNPFNPSTIINFSVPSAELQGFSEPPFVQLKVYDSLGREIATIVNERKTAGSYEVEFDAENLSSGIYFYVLTVGKFRTARKMILMR